MLCAFVFASGKCHLSISTLLFDPETGAPLEDVKSVARAERMCREKTVKITSVDPVFKWISKHVGLFTNGMSDTRTRKIC